MGGEAEPAGRPHGVGDLDCGESGVRDLPLDAERQVVPVLGADLGADQQEHAVVPALPAVAARRERVVIGQQHGIRAHLARGRQ